MPAMRAQASAVYIGVITIVASTGPVIVSRAPTMINNTKHTTHTVYINPVATRHSLIGRCIHWK